jgi:hypothetical protein
MIANTPGFASEESKKLVDSFMAGKLKIALRSGSAKIPLVLIMPRRRGQTF